MPFYQEIYTSFSVQLSADYSSCKNDAGSTSVELYLVVVEAVSWLPLHLRQPILDPRHSSDVEQVDVIDQWCRPESGFSPGFSDVKFDRRWFQTSPTGGSTGGSLGRFKMWVYMARKRDLKKISFKRRKTMNYYETCVKLIFNQTLPYYWQLKTKWIFIPCSYIF